MREILVEEPRDLQALPHNSVQAAAGAGSGTRGPTVPTPRGDCRSSADLQVVDLKPLNSPSRELSAGRGSESAILGHLLRRIRPRDRGVRTQVSPTLREVRAVRQVSPARPRPGADVRPDPVRSLLQWIWRLRQKVRAVRQRPGVVAQAGSASAAVGARAGDAGRRQEEVACAPATYATRDGYIQLPSQLAH